VRFELGRQWIYVVRNAWRGGYTVFVMSDEGKMQIGHYPSAREAVAAAADMLVQGESRDVQPSRLAS